MRATNIKEEKKDFWWLVILILIVLPVTFEFFFGQKLFNASHDTIISAQKFMYEKFNLKYYQHEDVVQNVHDVNDTIINDTNLNSSIKLFFESFLDEEKNIEEKKGFTKDLIISEVIHFMNSNIFYLILCAILLNFMNIYKIFVLSLSVFVSNYICSALSFIYQSPRPYMAFYKIKPAVVFNEWASPNNQIVVLITFGLCLYQALTKNKRMEKKLIVKILLIILLVLYIFIDIFLLFASGNCTFNHIIISVFFGISIFLILIYILKIDLNKSRQFYDIIKIKTLYYLAINALLFVFQILLCLFVIDKRDTTFYENHGKEQIERLQSNKYTNYREHLFLNNGNLCNLFCFLMNIIAFIALKADLYFNYDNNYNSWSEGNFEKAINNMDNSIQSDFNHIEETQWNHIGAGKAFVRFLLLLLFCFCIYGIFLWIFSNSQSETVILLFTITIPMGLIVFGTFYFFKTLLIKFKLGRPPKTKSKKKFDF